MGVGNGKERTTRQVWKTAEGPGLCLKRGAVGGAKERPNPKEESKVEEGWGEFGMEGKPGRE